MFAALSVSAGLAVLTVIMHLAGLAVLLTGIRRRGDGIDGPGHPMIQAGFIVGVVLALFVVHGLEICVFAVAYLVLGEVESVEAAIYFSTTTFTTLGYGDVILSDSWRLVAAVEGLVGFLLLGWSTAFLVSVIGRLRALEADLFERTEKRD